ncbi:hypothetical protein SAMN02982917_1989 [Azospirillum oryzae]|uniref:Uncharacterized protein n=1 Tax=Azospirillum oryzae TaxID=286727 RepID=A0A1X7ET40_9PROT|nr:hypothetical protein [Azospirillum oryzae]SMF39430.1 hypothetical protein SAMN02982917_1989 [Azospirillum oryzae]
MTVYGLDPVNTRTFQNAHFFVHVEQDDPAAIGLNGLISFGLIVEPKEGDVSLARVEPMAKARGFLRHLDHDYTTRQSATRAARRLLDGPLSRP